MNTLTLPDSGTWRSGVLTGTWTIHDARYAKGKRVVQITKDQPDGFKQRPEHLAEALGGKWTHRDKGYQMTTRRAELFKRLIADDWDAELRMFRGSKPTFIQPQTRNRFSLREVLDRYVKFGGLYAS